MTPSTPSKEDFAHWSRVWHDTCETIVTMLGLPGCGSPQELLAQVQAYVTPSTPATTDAGALADWIDETRREAEKRGDKEQANLLWRTGNVISHGSHTTYPSRDIAQSVRDVVRDLAAALRNSAPQETLLPEMIPQTDSARQFPLYELAPDFTLFDRDPQADDRLKLYRDIFAEITAKAIPVTDPTSNDPDRVREYRLPVGPLHRAAGKLGFQLFDGERHLASAIAEIERLKASPQETRGDEPVAWVKISDGPKHIREFAEYCEIADDRNGYIEYCGTTTDGRPYVICLEGPYSAKYDRYFILPHVDAASQQSPRLEREGVASEVRKAKVHVVEQWEGAYGYVENAESLKVADAILALLSPSGPMVPWELDCQHKICAAPECECPAVSSTGQVWQPADTAPQDGSTIEVRFLTDNPRRVRWSQSDRGTYWHLADSNGPAIINFNPTEWRPVSSNHPREVGK